MKGLKQTLPDILRKFWKRLVRRCGSSTTWWALEHEYGLGLRLLAKTVQHSAEGVTYAEADCEGFMDEDPPSPVLWGNLGDAGRDESVSSSMSECDEGGLVDFFFPKACLNELLSWKKDRNYLSCLFALGECCFGALVCRCHPSHCLGSVCKSRVLTVAAQYL